MSEVPTSTPEPVGHTLETDTSRTFTDLVILGDNAIENVLRFSQSDAAQKIRENPEVYLVDGEPNRAWLDAHTMDLSQFDNFVVMHDSGTTRAYIMETGEPMLDFVIDETDLTTKAIMQILNAPETAFPTNDELRVFLHGNDHEDIDILVMPQSLMVSESWSHLPISDGFWSPMSISNRVRILNTRADPYYAVVHLTITFPSGMATASGFLINANTVLTAGHNLFSPSHGGWAREVIVRPGRNGDISPYNVRFNQTMWVGGSWHQNQSIDGDFGIIRLTQNASDVPSYFWLDVRSDLELVHRVINITGYPGDVAPNTMHRSTGSITSVTRHRIYTNAFGIWGLSGSPIYTMGGWVVGIQNTAGTHGSGNAGGVRINQDLIGFINSIR